MSVSTRTRGRSRRSPAPAEAGANLLIHDLKNLACRLDLLCANLGNHYGDPNFKTPAIDLIDDTAVHLKRLARDLREHEERILVKLRIDINAAVEEAILDSRPDLAGHVELIERYGKLPFIWGDAYLLRRAFACAIENALEAMAGEGVLSVRTGTRRVRGGERAFVEIADTGPGIDEGFMRRGLFKPFSSTKEEGLGLGVYTIRQVAALHGGTVRIASGRDTGTRVRFHLPVER